VQWEGAAAGTGSLGLDIIYFFFFFFFLVGGESTGQILGWGNFRGEEREGQDDTGFLYRVFGVVDIRR